MENSSSSVECVKRQHKHDLAAYQCSSSVTKHIKAPVDIVWSLVRRFDQPQMYKPFIIRDSKCSDKDAEVGALVMEALHRQAFLDIIEKDLFHAHMKTKKKSKTLGDAQGTHTVQTGAKDTVTTPSQIQLNVTPINVESQPKSLVIEAPQTPN
ncbi:hypothetical protein AgCh_009071 [Apium graveolens]